MTKLSNFSNEGKLMILHNITQSVGKTPLVQIRKVIDTPARVIAKVEASNPMSSVKDRIAISMIDAAISAGDIIPGESTIIEPTSGNTGIALAMVCACRGLECILTMPDSMSIERRKVLLAMGAKLELTPSAEGMTGAINRARQIAQLSPSGFIPQQFSNPANPQAHFENTGPELWSAANGEIDIFVAGVGTGGTLTGTGRYLRSQNPDVKIVAIEPDLSPVISQTLEGKPINPQPHQIQGIGAGFVPDVLDLNLIDEVIKVDIEQSVNFARQAAIHEGLFVGISSGSALYAASLLANRPENMGKTIATVLPSFGERYLSTVLFDNLKTE